MYDRLSDETFDNDGQALFEKVRVYEVLFMGLCSRPLSPKRSDPISMPGLLPS